MAVQSDGHLADLVARGHERAFEVLVRRYRGPLLRYCRRMGLSEPQAEDVLQHSLTKAWLALDRGSEVRDVRPWLYRIVHNMAVSAMRRAAEPSDQLNDTVEAVAIGRAAPEIDGALAARDALGHVAALPPMQRDAVVLAAIQGRSHEEVADALGVSDGAVRGLLHRARTTMRSAAAALTPQGLIEWLARGPGTLSLTERSSELAAGGGAIGVAGAAVKGALLAATASVMLAGGAVVQSVRDHHAGPGARAGASTHAATASTSLTASTGSGSQPGASAGLAGGSDQRGVSRSAGERRLGHAEHDGRRGRAGARGGTSGGGGAGEDHRALTRAVGFSRERSASANDGSGDRGRGEGTTGRDGSGERGASSGSGGKDGGGPAPGEGSGSDGSNAGHASQSGGGAGAEPVIGAASDRGSGSGKDSGDEGSKGDRPGGKQPSEAAVPATD